MTLSNFVPNAMIQDGDMVTQKNGAAFRVPAGTVGQTIVYDANGIPGPGGAGIANPMTTANDFIVGGAAGVPLRQRFVESALLPPAAPFADNEEFDVDGSPGGMTWLNQGGATDAERLGRVILSKSFEGAGVNNIRLFVKPLTPAGAFRMRTRMSVYGDFNTDCGGGFVLHNVAGVKSCIFHVRYSGASLNAALTIAAFDVAGFTAVGGLSTPFSVAGIAAGMNRVFWLQLRRDAAGPTLFFDYSPDGVFFATLGSVLQTTIMAATLPDRYGFFLNAPSAAGNTNIGFDFFRVDNGNSALNP